MVPELPARTVLVDDLRSFVDGRVAQVARSSAAGVEVLGRHRGQRLDELWLDHDLGGDDTIWPVVEVLERAAFDERSFDIGVVYIHSANPAGAARLIAVRLAEAARRRRAQAEEEQRRAAGAESAARQDPWTLAT
jgi:hypothetical protein